MSGPRPAFVVGAGLTPFGDRAPRTTLDLMADAAEAALADAHLSRGDVDGLLVGYSTTFPHLMLSTAFAEHFGLAPRYGHGIQLGGATGLAMVAAARHLVAAGASDRMLVVAGENRRTGASVDTVLSTLAQVGDPVHEVPNGANVPAYYALLAARYLHDHGLSERDLAGLAVLMRAHAARYPGAHFHEPVTVADVMASRPIATPLKRLDCCPISDGAAAIVVSAEPAAVPVRIAGTGQGHTHQSLSNAPDDVARGARLSAASAFEEAGVTPDDVGLAGVYDSFTVTLAMLLEATGLSREGSAPADVSDGRYAADGRVPLNLHGGLLGYGHPGVAGGMAHAVEVFRQMAGRSPLGSLAPADVALIHADGGILSSHVSVVLRRDP